MENLENNSQELDKKVDKKKINEIIFIILFILIIIIMIGIILLIFNINNNQQNIVEEKRAVNVNTESVLENISEDSINNSLIDLQEKNELLQKKLEKTEEEELLEEFIY